MATGNSTRSRPSGRARNTRKAHAASSAQKKAAPAQSRRKPKPKGRKPTKSHPDLDQILGHFSKALAFVETGYAALNAAEEYWSGDAARIGTPAIRTIEHGIAALGRVHGEVDLAFMALSQKVTS